MNGIDGLVPKPDDRWATAFREGLAVLPGWERKLRSEADEERWNRQLVQLRKAGDESVQDVFHGAGSVAPTRNGPGLRPERSIPTCSQSSVAAATRVNA
jgi:hypothetical protein